MFTQKRICKISWSQVQDSDVPRVETTGCTRNNIISHIINLTKLLAAMLVNMELYHNIRGAPNLHTARTPTYRCGHAQDVSALYACMQTCIPVCVCVYVCLFLYVWMYAGIYAYMHMSECVCICRYAACMHVCMRAWMHAYSNIIVRRSVLLVDLVLSCPVLSPPVLSYPTYSVVSCPVLRCPILCLRPVCLIAPCI